MQVQGSGEQIVQVNGNNIMHPTGEEAPHSPAPADGEVQQLMPLPASPRLNHSEEDPPVIEPEGSDQPAVPDVVSDGRSSSKRKHEDVDEESDATDVESDDFEEEVENDDDEEEDDAFDASEGQEAVIQSPASTTIATATTTTPVSIKSRRPSRSCKPNSLIFNSDTTTLSPKRRRKLVNNGQAIGSTAAISKKSSSSHQQSPSPSSDLIHSQRTGSRKSTREHHKNKQQQPAEQQPLISSRSFARESVRKAVSALTGLNRPVKKLGRPRKYPIEMTGESVNPIKNGRIAVGRGVKGRKVVRGKKLTVKKGSPAGKCTPILTAILSGQSLAQTKTGRPKGRPRVLPSLDEVILNGAKSSPNTSATRSSPRRCDCEAKYKKILSNLEQSLEVKFAESTHKVCSLITHSLLCDH